jgi:hypothetical protein
MTQPTKAPAKGAEMPMSLLSYLMWFIIYGNQLLAQGYYYNIPGAAPGGLSQEHIGWFCKPDGSEASRDCKLIMATSAPRRN